MPKYRKTLFISDLHLEEKRPEITHTFIGFLDNLTVNTDAVYILGDLFEAWIGDDEKLPFHAQVIAALKKVTEKNIPVYFLYGNRDFLIGKRFLRETGCRLLADVTKIMLYDTPVLLMHGDTLCTKDLAYLKARKIIRNRFYLSFFSLLPLTIRKHIAARMRLKSKLHTKTAAFEIMDVTQDEVEAVMQKHDVHYLIHGHTHKPAIHHFSFNSLPMTRIVLGAWHNCGNVLEWDEVGKKELIDFGNH